MKTKILKIPFFFIPIQGFENQARWISKLFCGQSRLPQRQLIDSEIKYQALKRDPNHLKNMQTNEYPRESYNKLIDTLAKQADSLPDFARIAKHDPDLYEMLWVNGTVPAHFSYNNPKTREISLKLLHEVDEMINKKYCLCDEDLKSCFYNSDYLPTLKLAELFAKNYKIPIHLFRDWEKREDEFCFANLSTSVLRPDVVNKLIKGFEFFDKDKNGWISINELPAVLRWLNVNVTEEFMLDLVDAMVDTVGNRNPELVFDLNEFLRFAEYLVVSGTHQQNLII
jgi:hypothetical protein